MTNIQPLHDRVIVKRIDEGEQVRGGIITPDSAKEKSQEGEVIAAGLGKYKEDGSRQPLDVNTGDRVLFGKYGGSEIDVNGEKLLIMREDEILGTGRTVLESQRSQAARKSRRLLVKRDPGFCNRDPFIPRDGTFFLRAGLNDRLQSLIRKGYVC
jgi:chaperonin GroES